MPDVFQPPDEQQPKSINPIPSSLNKQTNTVNIFSAFAQNPEGIKFSQQEDNEEIILFLRRHIITNLPWIIGTLILIAAPILIGYVLQAINIPFTFLFNRFIFLILAFYYLIVIGYAFANFVNWF